MIEWFIELVKMSCLFGAWLLLIIVPLSILGVIVGQALPELGKLVRLVLVWLMLIFLPVWLVSWAVGVYLPECLSACNSQVASATAEVLRALVPITAVMVFIPINAMFMVLIERRALAIFTQRMGPNRFGFDGLFQTAADAVKLLLKEDITPTGADAFMFTLAPIIFFAPSIFGAIPLLAAVTNNHPLFQIVNLPTGIFFVLAASSVPVVGMVMGSWASNNKYSLMGGLRSAAQAISYELPLVLSIVTVCLLAGTLDVVKIAEQQKGGFFNWNIFGGGALIGFGKWIEASLSGSADPAAILTTYYPEGMLSLFSTLVLCICTIVLFGVYITGACAEINRIPFDLPEAESELVSGFNTEYSGIKFAIFFLAEFTNLFIVSTIAVVMFFGGGDCLLPPWANPFYNPAMTAPFAAITGPMQQLFDPLFSQVHLLDITTFWAAIWVIAKTYSLVLVAILVRGTLPRFRIDQLMGFGWKRLIPITLAVFVFVIFARGAVHFHV
jgi:NADH-quinone oxidoreductase subunit H